MVIFNFSFIPTVVPLALEARRRRTISVIIKSNCIGGFIKVNENLMWVDRYGICLSYKIKSQFDYNFSI